MSGEIETLTRVKKYQVIGDAGCHTEQLLFDDDSSSAAINWAKAYTKGHDLGGYESVTVLYYKPDGEAIDLWRICDDD
ncbi:MAG: hypothetical protein ACKO0Z_06905 [Betaproteobacteria bacterium]